MSQNYSNDIVIKKLISHRLQPVVMLFSAFISQFCLADTNNNINFIDIIPNPSTGVIHERYPSLSDELLNQFKLNPLKFGPNEINSIENLFTITY